MTLTLSAYRNSYDTAGVDVSLDAVVKRIRTGDRGLDEKTQKCHRLLANAPKSYRAYKEANLPAVTFAGIFPYRKRLAEHLSVHSGHIVIDIDGLMAEPIPDLLVVFSQHPNVVLAFISPSGEGIKLVCRVAPVPLNDNEHKAAWQACVDAFSALAEEYDFVIDPSGKDCSRMCYLAHDPTVIYKPDDHIVIQWDRDAHLKAEAEREKRRVELESRDWGDTEKDKSALDVIDPDEVNYEDWLRVLIGCKSAGMSWQEVDAWSRRGVKHKDGDIEKRWDKLRGDVNWGTVIWLAMQNGYKPPKQTQQKPIRLQKRTDADLVTEALTASWNFLSEAFEKGKGFVGLRSDTGTGKDHHAILHYQKTAVQGFYSVPTTDHAKETEARMNSAGLIEFRWRGLHSERDGAFPHEAPCTQPDAYTAYLNSGRNAYELLCTRCPYLDICLQDGFRSQEAKAKKAQVIISAHKDLLFNPSFRHLAKRLLPSHKKDLTVINEFDCFESFIDIQIPQARLEYLAKTWHDHSLGTFAEQILKACLFNENLIGSFRNIVNGLIHEEQQSIMTALTQYRIGDIVMSRDEAHAHEKRNPCKSLSDIIRLPLIETDDWNLLIQLELFFENYKDDATAPLRWTNNTLSFPIPPLPLYSPARVICMNATLEELIFLKTFESRQTKRGDVSFLNGNDTAWHPDAKVYQLRTNKNPRKTLLTAEQNEKGDWIYAGMTKTGEAYMDKILKSLSETDGSKAFISYKFIVDLYRDQLDGLGVKVGWFGGLSGLDAHFGRDKDAGITLHILGTPEIPPGETEYRANLLGLTTDEVHNASVKAELMQAVGRAGLVKNPSHVFLWTSIELPSVTHREQTSLMDDTDWETDAELDSTIDMRETAEQDGDIDAMVEATGVSERTAYRRKADKEKLTKQDMVNEAYRLSTQEDKTFEEIGNILGKNKATISRWMSTFDF